MKIAYVDDEEKQHDDFLRSAMQSGVFEEENIHLLYPKPTLSEMVEQLLSADYEGFVFDFNLKGSAENVSYNGFTLREKIINRNKFLSCIIITNYVSEAFSNKNDVWIITDKQDINDESFNKKRSSNFGFFDKLKLSIEKSKNDLKNTNNRYNSLLKKYDKDDINEFEFDELIELDTSLEYYLNKKNRFAKDIKRRDHAPYIQLIKNANKLADKLEGKTEDKFGKDFAHKKKPDVD